MANFAPMKQRFLMVLNYNLDRFGVKGRFLDYGCGAGDVSHHLLTQGSMSEGVAFDPSFKKTEVEALNQQNMERGLRFTDLLEDEDRNFDLAVLFDVIEHIPDVEKLIADVHSRVRSEGWLTVIVPYNSHEWGVDDEFHGHLRRLSKKGVISLLERNGWNVIRTLYPRRFDIYFESIFPGFKVFLMCQKRESQPVCHVCRQGNYSYFKTFDRYALQKCGFCRSEFLLPEYEENPYDDGYYTESGTRFFGLMELMVHYFRYRRIKFLSALSPPERSILDIGCGRGLIVAAFAKQEWRAVGTQRSQSAAQWARKQGAEVLLADVDEIPSDQPFGIVTLFHVIEHLPDLSRSLDHLMNLVVPGGYLVLEYPNLRSLLKKISGFRWFALDPPYHRHFINPRTLSDILGINNFRLIKEQHFSMEYSFFVFAQTVCNIILPFQRDAFYRVLQRKELSPFEYITALISAPFFALSFIFFLPFQLLASLFRRGCNIRQVYRKMSIPGQGGADEELQKKI